MIYLEDYSYREDVTQHGLIVMKLIDECGSNYLMSARYGVGDQFQMSMVRLESNEASQHAYFSVTFQFVNRGSN